MITNNTHPLTASKICIALFAVWLSVCNVAGESFTYRDKMNRSISVEIPVKRAVLLNGTELLPITGAWQRVVGLSRTALGANDLLKVIKPDLAELIPSVGNNHHINAEKLLKLRPDIVLLWSANPEIINYLSKRNIPIIAVFPENILELYEMMRLHGKLFASEANIESAIVKMRTMFSLIKKRVGIIPDEQRKKALWIFSKPTRIGGGVGIYNDITSIIGQHNLGQKFSQHTVDVSLEQLLAWNPDVIYIWGHARYSAADILNNPQWRHITAVKEKRVFKVPKWDTWSPRMAPLALWLAAAVYPEQFEDLNIDHEIDQFYRDVYGVTYKDVQQIEN